MVNQNRGHTDRVSCPTMEIPGRQITDLLRSKRKKKQLNLDGPTNRQEAPAPTN